MRIKGTRAQTQADDDDDDDDDIKNRWRTPLTRREVGSTCGAGEVRVKDIVKLVLCRRFLHLEETGEKAGV